MILAIGYRVRSPRGIQFRHYASTVLKEYLIKGFAMDDERLKNLGGGSYFKELLERIRDIRSSEKVFYRQVLDLLRHQVTTMQTHQRQRNSLRRFKTRCIMPFTTILRVNSFIIVSIVKRSLWA